MKCRFCKTPLSFEFVNLNTAPPSNAFLKSEQLAEAEMFYPLKLYVCEHCFLAQVDEHKKCDEIFDAEYVYFSSFSESWLKHAEEYTSMITRRLGLDASSVVTEIAANDGYLLQYFVKAGIPCLGVEPTHSTAKAAREKGIEIVEQFFTSEMAGSLKQSDLIIGNNVLAHVPDINDFVTGLKRALKPSGTVTMEFPHLMQLVALNQFDTIYHEHFSYLSLGTVIRIFEHAGLTIYDVEELPTHGGSLRIYAAHTDAGMPSRSGVKKVLEKEHEAGMGELAYYRDFQRRVDAVKNSFLSFLIDASKAGKSVVGYGAAAKGNTLLNYCGVKRDLVTFVADRSPHKQGLFLPGSRIPVLNEKEITELKPDYIVIFPWNIKDEIMNQLAYTRTWGCKFVIAIPTLEVL